MSKYLDLILDYFIFISHQSKYLNNDMNEL